MAPNAESMNVHQTLNTGWYPDGNNPSISLYPSGSSTNMVGTHHFYMAVSPTQIIVNFNDVQYTYYGSFDRSNYFGTTQTIYFADNSFDFTNVVFSNICIRTSWSSFSTSSTTTTTTTTKSGMPYVNYTYMNFVEYLRYIGICTTNSQHPARAIYLVNWASISLLVYNRLH